MTDEPTFYQDATQRWHFCTVTNIYTLPMGAKFQCINAPVNMSTNHWSRTIFRVGMATDKHTGKEYRAYYQEYTKHYDACPVADEFIVYAGLPDSTGERAA
jgi:hypothetical protein